MWCVMPAGTNFTHSASFSPLHLMSLFNLPSTPVLLVLIVATSTASAAAHPSPAEGALRGALPGAHLPLASSLASSVLASLDHGLSTPLLACPLGSECQVQGCTKASKYVGTVSVVEEMSQYGVWERQLRLASIPNEIESRCRCKGWGRAQGEASRGPNPPSPTCEIDERYFVGSKRTM